MPKALQFGVVTSKNLKENWNKEKKMVLTFM